MRDRRKNALARKKYREMAEISAQELIMPVFIKEGIGAKKEIRALPGIYQFSLKAVVGEARGIYDAGITAIILFGIPLYKDEIGSSAYDAKGIIQEAIRAIKKTAPKLQVIADVCMCGYTAHGHCGVISKVKVDDGRWTMDDGLIDNDETIKILAKIALSYAEAGVDIVAPSAMMDFQVRAMKKALLKNNYPKVKIMAYSAKYASNFYGPFREAAESSPGFGDRKTYQMDYCNSDEALLEAKLDIQEGADIIMVKPALAYLDVIAKIKQNFKFPVAAYNVSGEYAMVKAYCQVSGIRYQVSEKDLVLEILTGIKRAGADLIITYHAKEVAKWLKASYLIRPKSLSPAG